MNHKPYLLWVVLAVLGLVLSSGGVLAQSASLSAFEVRWSPDGHWIGVGSSDGIWIFDAENLDAEPYHYAEGIVSYVVEFDPVRPYVAFASTDEPETRIIEIETGNEVFRADTPPDDDSFPVYYDLRYSDDGRYLSVLDTSLLYVLDASTGEQIRSYANPVQGGQFGSANWLTSLDYGESADTVLVGDWDANLFVYHLNESAAPEQHKLNIHEGGYQFEHFERIPGTSRIIVMGWGELYSYDLETGWFAPLGDWGDRHIDGFALSPDGTQVAVGAGTSWFRYDLADDRIAGKFPSTFTDPSEERNRLYSLAFSPQGDRLATLQTDGRLQIWDVASGEVVGTLGEFTNGVSQKWG